MSPRFSGPLTKDGLGRARRKQMFREEGTSGEMRISPTAALARGQARARRSLSDRRVGSGQIVAHTFLTSGDVSYGSLGVKRVQGYNPRTPNINIRHMVS